VDRIDFVTAFGRLLRDGSLRDAYAKDPLSTAEHVGIAASDRPAWLALSAEQLELQAEILLRKRFESVSRLLPGTVANAGPRAWPFFADYSRRVWPSGEPPELDDASRFCLYLDSKVESLVSATERNRVMFATNHVSAVIHFVRDAVVRNRRRTCVQILVRARGRAWREVLLYLGL
jgi:hypothetical protein